MPHACATWPLSESTLTYFPDARFETDRDLVAGVVSRRSGFCRPGFRRPGGFAVAPSVDPAPAHVPVLLDRCVELLAPALTARAADGSGAVLVDATLGAAGHAERFLSEFAG